MSAPTSISTETLTPAALAALRGSIRKWERIVAGTGVDEGMDNCALCQEFFEKNDTCKGCPVRQATGKSNCKGSPYDDFDDAKNAKFFRRARMHYHAIRELEFLRSLIPLDKLETNGG